MSQILSLGYDSMIKMMIIATVSIILISFLGFSMIYDYSICSGTYNGKTNDQSNFGI